MYFIIYSLNLIFCLFITFCYTFYQIKYYQILFFNIKITYLFTFYSIILILYL